MAGTLTLSGIQTGVAEGAESISLTVSLGSVHESLPVVLASGANTITVPAGAVDGVVIVPPASNTVGLTLKGVTGDTGVRISPSSFSVVWFDPTAVPASLVVTATAAVSSATQFIFV